MFAVSKNVAKTSALRGLSLAAARAASTLVVAEHAGAKLSEQTLSVVTAATQVGGDVTVLVAGSDAEAVSKQVSGLVSVQGVVRWF